ncbi:efflux RND transporter periplasmic adaptor subunit [Segetibacter koreensis]|uniref:efflux RND transporter periplasmic adaptor subunit n=1 Tax=Segetibacter koreensis TaxID=398037 RepID=UPI00035FDB06|nr:efflux RND transporter periplasmic adaptor subunit [Segetibacter koreensis]
MFKDFFHNVAGSCANKHLLLGTVVPLIFISALSLTMLFLGSCQNQNANTHSSHNHPTPATTTYYTCSMHPQVQLANPGKCPICGMTLIRVEKSVTPKPDELLLSDQQIRLGNISVDTLSSGGLGDELTLTATLNFNQQKTTTISSRVMGRIERLYFKNVGDYVSKGQKLFDLYSEDLNNAKQEYILAVERQKVLENSMIDFNELIQGAKNKLLLWGLNDAQITALAQIKKASPVTTFYSNTAGYITTLDAREGDYVMEGGAVVHLADLSSLWVEAQLYASQFATIDKNATAIVQVPDMPGHEIKGKIDFVNPEINPETHINLIRVVIPNPNNHLKPGMPAYVYIRSRQRKALTLPIDAVIRDVKGATVWVKTGHNTFKSKMVDVGLEGDDKIEILSGLHTGDVVVVTGAYLLNSEYIFRKGANPMAGHEMGKM